MRLKPKNTFIASALALLLGSSCCWLTTLAVWLGGASILTVFSAWLSPAQPYLLLLGLSLLAWGIFLILRRRGCCSFLDA
jgi:uncharacterized RDD family membrane protein YckC